MLLHNCFISQQRFWLGRKQWSNSKLDSYMDDSVKSLLSVAVGHHVQPTTNANVMVLICHVLGFVLVLVTTKCNMHLYPHLHLHPKTYWKLNYKQEFVSMHNHNNFCLCFKCSFIFSFKYSPILLYNLLTNKSYFSCITKKKFVFLF